MSLRIKIDDTPEDIIYFNSDDEFTDFCLLPFAVFTKNSLGLYYYTGAYSEAYLKAIEEGMRFVIKDKDSVVFKRKFVTKRLPVKLDNGNFSESTALVQMPVQNLDEYLI